MFKNKKGFTMVELLIVIGVLGLLSAMIIPSLGLFDKAKGTVLNVNSKNLESAIFQYYFSNNVYPASDTPVGDVMASAPFMKIALVENVPNLDKVDNVEKFVSNLNDQGALVEVNEDLKNYIKNSNINLSEYFIIKEISEPNAIVLNSSKGIKYNNELAGFIFSKKSINDPDGFTYNSVYKIKTTSENTGN